MHGSLNVRPPANHHSTHQRTHAWISRLRLRTTPFPTADPTDINERITISLGHALLSQFVTVWDFPLTRSIFYGHLRMSSLDRLKQLGFELPPPFPALGSYNIVTTAGDQVFVSGLGPIKGGQPVVGLVGDDMTLGDAQDAARMTMLQILSGLEQS